MMDDEFPIIIVDDYLSEAIEPIGSKYKFWFTHPSLGRALFKEARPSTGEDWAEKVSCAICEFLLLPHAHYELAIYKGRRGVVSPYFLPENAVLVHGNELLVAAIPDYPGLPDAPKYNISEHTVDVVLDTIDRKDVYLPPGWQPFCEEISKPVDVFVGYLLIDSLIGNTDRHHQNWAFMVISEPVPTKHLAPSFDHGSSLGRNESDKNKLDRLNSKDQGYTVEAYANRTLSALYKTVGDKKPMRTMDAFALAANRYPETARVWLSQLENIASNTMQNIFERIPSTRISELSVRFALEMLFINKRKLLSLSSKL
jgi:hypothetical protein